MVVAVVYKGVGITKLLFYTAYITTHSQTPIFWIVPKVDKRYL